MTGAESNAIQELSREVRGYHADLLSFKRQATPALTFYSNLVAASHWLKYGVGIGAGVATIIGALKVVGMI